MTNARLTNIAFTALGVIVGATVSFIVTEAVGFYLPPAAWSWDTTVAAVSAIATIVIAIIAGTYSRKRQKEESKSSEREAAGNAMAAAVKFRVRKSPDDPGKHRWSTFSVSAVNLREIPIYDVELWIDGRQVGETGKALFEDARPFEWQKQPLGSVFRRQEDAGAHLNAIVWPTVEVRYSVLGRRFSRRLGDTLEVDARS